MHANFSILTLNGVMTDWKLPRTTKRISKSDDVCSYETRNFLSLSYSLGVLPNGDISKKLVLCNERKIWYFRNYRKNESHNLLRLIKIERFICI